MIPCINARLRTDNCAINRKWRHYRYDIPRLNFVLFLVLFTLCQCSKVSKEYSDEYIEVSFGKSLQNNIATLQNKNQPLSNVHQHEF